MKYVFGPVPSRRLGRSLGIDPVPLKTCNWNCVYCQLGRTTGIRHVRQVYASPQEVIAEVEATLRAHAAGDIDWLTIVGSGEPTLNGALGEMIERLKDLTTIPVAVLTNGSLLHLPEVRRDLRQADVVVPSLDAGSEVLYRKVNRAAPDLDFAEFLDGLVAFRKEFPGRIWVEVMLVKGLNDTDQALRDIVCALQRIQPDEVHINLPTRPPAEPWVEVADEESISRAEDVFGGIARVVRPTGVELNLAGSDDPVAAIAAVVARHPMREEELVRALERWDASQVELVLGRLASSGQAQRITRHGELFWTGVGTRYVDDSLSRCHGPRR